MIISHAHKFIYIKPTKVAGTSTQILLSKFCGENDVITPIGSKPQNYYPKNYIVTPLETELGEAHESSLVYKSHMRPDRISDISGNYCQKYLIHIINS